jgi:hypothetical protein
MVIIPQDLKPNEVCIMHSTQVVFFSQFCDLVPLAIITRGINQIWLHVTICFCSLLEHIVSKW